MFDEKTLEALLYYHSTMRKKKDQAIGCHFINSFEQELAKLSNRLHKKQCVKKYDKVTVKIGGLRQKFSKVSSRYTISVKKDEKSANATELNLIQEMQ